MVLRYPAGLGPPTPRHSLTEAAEHAREALRNYGRTHPIRIVIDSKGKHRAMRVRLEDRAALPLVTKHPKPWRQVDPLELTGAPGTFARKAHALGYEVAARSCGVATQVGVALEGALWMRAMWSKGRTAGVMVEGRHVGVKEAEGMLGG